MPFLIAFALALMGFSLFSFAGSLKVAAMLFRRNDLRWQTAWLVACASVVLSGASSLLGHADIGLGVPSGVGTALQLLTGIACWVVAVVWVRKALDIGVMRALALLVLSGIFFVIFSGSVAFAVRAFAFQAFKVASGAMLPTVQAGDHLLANKYVYRFRDPVRGEVIVFRGPEDRSKDFIKRVIAVGGEAIEIRGKRIFINGKPIHDPWGIHEDSVMNPEGSEKRDDFGPVTVPPGRTFVMGDNRDNSYDSRFWGSVPREDVKGKAFILYWSEDEEAKEVRWQRIGKKIDQLGQEQQG